MLKSGVIVAFFTLLSRIFGLIREFVIASYFGTTLYADCVNIAFKFPNLFRRIFGEGALSSVFIPIFSKKLSLSELDAKIFAGRIIAILTIILVIITIILEITMPYLMALMAPGFLQDSEKFELAISLCRVTTPYLIFLSVTAIFGGMLNSVRKFWPLAFAPIIMSLSVIISAYPFQNFISPYNIAYSLIIAGILQVIFMLFCLKKFDLMPKLSLQKKELKKDADIAKMVKNFVPATISSGAQQLNLFISHSISSFLPGAISVLSYADRLYQMPLSLIGITFGTILLPELSKLYKKQDYISANILQNRAIKISLLIALPAAFGLGFMSKPIIHLIYQRGEFTGNDTIITAKVLAAFSLGLPAFTLAKIFTPIYYANLDTKTPLKITLNSIIINILLNILLMIPFGIIGIAIGSSISIWINVWWLYKGIKKFGDFVISKNILRFTFKLLISSLLMIAYIGWAELYVGNLFFHDKIFIKLSSIFGVIFSAMLIFIISALMLNIHKMVDDEIKT